MSKQSQRAESDLNKNKPRPEPIVGQPINETPAADSLSVGSVTATGGEGIEGQANLLNNKNWQSVQRQNIANHIGRVQGNQHLQRMITSLKSQEASKLAPQVVQRQHQGAMAVPFTWTGGEKEFKGSVGSLIARKVYWTFEGSFTAGDQPEKAGDAGFSAGATGGASKEGGGAGFKIEDVQRLCSDEFSVGGIPALTTLDTKETFQLTSEAIEVSVALEGGVGVTFKALNLQAGASFSGQLTLLKKEFAKLKDGDEAASKPAKFANASFALAVPVVGWQPTPGITIQGKLSGVYEVEPNWPEILRRITERLGNAATSAAIETAIAAGFVLGGFLTIGAAVANVMEGDWVGEYCRQKSEGMVMYLQDYDGYMRGTRSGGSQGFVDAAQHIKKVYEAGQADGVSTREIDESLKSRPNGFYAAEIWNRTKAQVFAQAEKDYWEEHSITQKLHNWGMGSNAEDRDFISFKRALNAHIDGKMFPLFGIKAGWL